MNSEELNNILKSHKYTRKIFGGVYPSDFQPPLEKKNKKIAYIFNLDPSNKKGSHWISVFLSRRSNEYFDSFGLTPDLKILKKFKRRKFRYTNKIIQNPFSATCGQYCLFYILKKSKKYSFNRIMKYFGNDVIKNDLKIKKMIKKHFNKKTKIYDIPFLIKQISKSIY
jgi:hypothetical protein